MELKFQPICILSLTFKTERLIGVEIDEKWANLSRKVAKKFELDDKVEIHNCDIGSKDGLKLVSESDLIIMHNPFEWFTKDGGQSIFARLTENFKEQILIFTI